MYWKFTGEPAVKSLRIIDIVLLQIIFNIQALRDVIESVQCQNLTKPPVYPTFAFFGKICPIEFISKIFNLSVRKDL